MLENLNGDVESDSIEYFKGIGKVFKKQKEAVVVCPTGQ